MQQDNAARSFQGSPASAQASRGFQSLHAQHENFRRADLSARQQGANLFPWFLMMFHTG